MSHQSNIDITMEDDEDDMFSCFERKRKISAHIDPPTLPETFASHASIISEQNSITITNDDEPQEETIEQIEKTIMGHYKSTIVKELTVNGSASHQVIIPEMDEEYRELKPRENLPPAKEYPFELDSFQKEAIKCIENDQSVLVAAHTSAGKTVIAQYAIAQSLKNQQRVIYTSPIKALSNQKYRELAEEFVDVGLQTGDVTINPGASCLVMTTEILRSMLYRGSELMREVGWVIFDEIHYMRDKVRGVVWEETIILLPHNVRYVFLSATIPNAVQFAQWIGVTHKQVVHVISTDLRPTPLQHYIFPSGGNGLYLVVDEQGVFRSDNFNRAMSSLAGDEGSLDSNESENKKETPNSRGRLQNGRKQSMNTCIDNVSRLVDLGMKKNFSPMIIFSFSKKECEAYATGIAKMNFNESTEKLNIEKVFTSAIACLSDEDKDLPQVKNALPLLMRGVGIHHSGLMPILKEVTEILFSEGLIKVLFATETFAMGLNMPARTVIFTSIQKFDGKERRTLSSGEYIQMSGRAGRRGLDDRGIVILIADSKLNPNEGKNLLKGEPDQLNSAFRLTYNMLLNLLRLEGVNPEYMVEKSFHQFQTSCSIPEKLREVKQLQQKYNEMSLFDSKNDSEFENIPEIEIESYMTLKSNVDSLNLQLNSFVRDPKYILPYLQPGRLIKIKHRDSIYPWGCLVNFQKRKNGENYVYILELLINCDASTIKNPKLHFPKPAASNAKSHQCQMVVVPVDLELVIGVSCIKIFLPPDLRPVDSRKRVSLTINEIEKKFMNDLPLLDPIKDMKISDESFLQINSSYNKLRERLHLHPFHQKYQQFITQSKDGDNSSLECLNKKMEVGLNLRIAKDDLKQIKAVVQLNELKSRKRVLRRVELLVKFQGSFDLLRIIFDEINSADELLLTEMLFNGVFNELNIHQISALLSCFVFQEKTKTTGNVKLETELSGPLKILQDTAKKIAKVSVDAKFSIDTTQYVNQFLSSLMDVVYTWSKGASFSQISKMTDIFEGNIIRCIRRLEELARQLCMAAKVIGNGELEKKFSEAVACIKRDIIFAASLYL